jgi:hypothetical protein
MKKTMILILAFCTPLTVNATDIETLNMKLGHWVTTTDTSALVEKMLANVPKESRAMVKEMMQKKMESSNTADQCITSEILENFDKQIKETFSTNKECSFDVSESTSDKFAAEITCPGSTNSIITNVISSKRNESTITTKVAGVDSTTITSVSEWKSEVCPEGI